MSFELWSITDSPFFNLPPNFAGYIVLFIYAALFVVGIVRTYHDFLKLSLTQWMLLIMLAISAIILITSLRIQFPNTVSPPGIAIEPRGPTLSLLGYSPIILAIGFLGSGPALLVGLAAGIARAGWETYNLTTIFEIALTAGVLGWFIRQDYRGAVARVMRFPLVAAILTAASIWLLSYLSYLANSPTLGLVGLDFATNLWLANVGPLFGELIIAGVIGSLAFLLLEQWWTRQVGSRPPLYATSLNRRLLFTLMPLSLIGLLVLIWANLTVANQVATSLIVDQISRDSQSVANSVPYFTQAGQSALRTISNDSHFQQPATLNQWLSEQIRAIPYFRQLAFFDLNGKSIAVYPNEGGLANGLTDDEKKLFLLGTPQTLNIYPTNPKTESVALSFMIPVLDERTNRTIGILIGRTDLENNPLLKPAIDQLQSLKTNRGRGLIVDERNTIIYDSDRTQLLQQWSPSDEKETLTTHLANGTVYRDRGPGNTRRLVYSYPVNGYPWTIIIIMPNEVVLDQAAQITTPLIIILIVIGSIGALAVLFVASRITSPIQTLAAATARIAQGELDRPVGISGEDEVGRLGIAFERMRERLRARLSELNLLLQINQGIAGSLDLRESLPPLLKGALAATNGGGARLVLPRDDGQHFVIAEGSLNAILQTLDSDLLRITENEGRLVLENLNRARTIFDVSKAGGKVQALIALALRQENHYLGVLWIGFSKPHTFTETEVNFVSTLAGQAALAVSNSQLYEASEGGRQRLQAILASSPDAVIVTDRRERILLINPAAENIFSLNGRTVMGQPLSNVIHKPELLEAIRGNIQLNAPTQVTLTDGRTMFASASPIHSADGSLLGQVAVLRDVTYFKQLDELKSEFVATVSHDLRVPLTFMRGYTTMLPMVGQLNPKQTEFNQKIMIGIEQMSELVEDLLDLNRIEAGVGLAREECHIEEMISTVVSNLRNNATNKDIALTTQVASNLPVLSGDKTLLRQAISNLVDNAIKYTPNNGKIKVSAELREQSVVVAVQDTGVGIAPSDQARLFEKFFRVRQRETASVKGSGLGLAIVKSIIERHGGKIWVESRLGQGSTFYFALPV